MTRAFLVLCLYAASGCVTTQSVEFAGDLSRLGDDNCSQSEDEKNFSLYKNNEFQFAALLYWAISSEKIYLELTDAMSSTIAEAKLGRKFKSEFDVKTKVALPDLQVNQLGFLTYEGKNVGLKDLELSCLLMGKVPSIWLRSNASKYLPDEKAILYSDRDRSVAIYNKEGSWNDHCVEIEVPYLGVFDYRTVKVCSLNSETSFYLNDYRVLLTGVNN